MSQQSVPSSSAPTVDYPEWIISIALLVVFVGAYMLSLGWPAETAFLPRLLSGAGTVLLLVKLGAMVWSARSPVLPSGQTAARSGPAEATVDPSGRTSQEMDVSLLDGVNEEDQAEEEEFKDILAKTPWSVWAQSLGWLAGFFIGFRLFGLLVVLPIFTVLYLRIVARCSWLTCLLYVLGTAGLIYALFVSVLHLPLPQGIFPIFGE